MWLSGLMLFDYLRRVRPSALYYALVAQGGVFAAMTLMNIWFRKKPVIVYQFLFGDVHAFAAYLVLQIGLLVGLWGRKNKLLIWPFASALLIVYSLLLIASYSRSGIIAYAAMLLLYAFALLFPWMRRRDFLKRAAVLAVVLVFLILVVGSARHYFADAGSTLFEKLERRSPAVVKREIMPRLIDLKDLFDTRIHLLTPADFYVTRVRNWAVPIAMIRDYPLFGIGVGEFYRRSADYAKRAPPNLYWKYPENAHNYYFQIAAETGLVGLVVFVSLLVSLLGRHLQLTDSISLGCGLAVVGLMIFNVAQHPLLVDRVFFVFIMVCATLAAQSTVAQRSRFATSLDHQKTTSSLIPAAPTVSSSKNDGSAAISTRCYFPRFHERLQCSKRKLL